MLKFVAAPRPGKPTPIGLGLSHENLDRLRKDAIQFFASELRLGDGLFIIAHGADPKLPEYQIYQGAEGPKGELLVRELLILSEDTCNLLRTAPEVLTLPLRSTLDGNRCQALVFAGPTEEIILESMKKVGLVKSDTQIVGPGPAPAPSTGGPAEMAVTDVFPVSQLNLLKLIGGGIGFLVLTAVVGLGSRNPAFPVLLMLTTAAVLLTMGGLRWRESVEIDDEGVRRVHPLGGFTVRWSELASIRAREDSLGPYELHLVTQSGQVHKLSRIYEEWKALTDEILLRATGKR